MPSSADGEHQRKTQIKDHRAGRVTAWKGRGLNRYQVRLDVRPDPSYPKFLRFAQAPADGDDRNQRQRETAMAGAPQPRRADNSGGDEDRWLAERGEDARGDEQRRAMAGVERLIDLPVERAPAPFQHGEPDRRERDERPGESDVRGARPGR